jgi:uncharacterized protein (UPF0332 family)
MPSIILKKTRVAAHSAQLLLDAGDVLTGACNRAYYAMFDADYRGALIGSGAVPNVFEIKAHAGLISNVQFALD